MSARIRTLATVAVACAFVTTSIPAYAAPTPPPPSPSPAPVFIPGHFEGSPGARPVIKLDGLGTVVYALDHTPSLLAQRAQVLNLDSTFTIARAAEYPSFAGRLENQIQREANESIAGFGIAPVNNFSENTADLESTYTIYNGAQQLAAQQAKRNVENAKYELTRQDEQTAVNVSNAFYNLAALHGGVGLDIDDLRYQQVLLDNARASERVGRVAGVDVLRAQVAVARSTATLLQARTNEANARESLAVLIGAPWDTVFLVPDVVPDPAAPKTDVADLEEIAKMNRPEIFEARAALASSKLGDAAVDNNLRPTVTANASFGSQVSPTSFVQEQESIDESNAAAIASYQQEKALFPTLTIPAPALLPPVDRHMSGFWQFNIVSTFLIPLYDYGQRAAAPHAARAQIVSSLASLYNAYDSVAADVNAARRNLDSATQNLALAKLAAQQARESARIAQLQYKNGLISFTDATQTQQIALSAENDLVSARVTYVTAFIRLRAALAPPNTAAVADLRGL
ncbi:MAG: TolC family protein [Candidatus Eremiobacteraeota bacterium]|nr:TolC family protein [Candidatus Eremiobacteraeota bacterium]